jgi:23S rRNA (guanine745-N1)-methyltransferase
MNPDIVAALRCPYCASSLYETGAGPQCLRGHTFDIARQGYSSLLPGYAKASTADSPDMVAARESFLAAGHFAPLRAVVAETVSSLLAEVVDARGQHAPVEALTDALLVVDAGGGIGYYLAAVLERLPGAIGLVLDLSKHALRRAARSHPRAGAVVCDLWKELPLHDSCAAAFINVFAPRNPQEFRRVLIPEGVLVVVVPTARHLRQMVAEYGLLTVDSHKIERLDASLDGLFGLREIIPYRETLHLPVGDALTLVAMGPSAHHLDQRVLAERLPAGPALVTTDISVELRVYRRR